MNIVLEGALKPLEGNLPENGLETIKMLEKTFIPISQEEMNKLIEGKHDYYLFNDIYDNKVVTFGYDPKDDKPVLKTLKAEYAKKILDEQEFKCCECKKLKKYDDLVDLTEEKKDVTLCQECSDTIMAYAY